MNNRTRLRWSPQEPAQGPLLYYEKNDEVGHGHYRGSELASRTLPGPAQEVGHTSTSAQRTWERRRDAKA